MAVKTKGGLRFVSPSGKKSSLAGSGRVSVRHTDKLSEADIHTTASNTTTAAAARGNKQLATIAPTSQQPKVMMSRLSVCLPLTLCE